MTGSALDARFGHACEMPVTPENGPNRGHPRRTTAVTQPGAKAESAGQEGPVAKPCQGGDRTWLVLARDFSDSVRVGGQLTVAAALVFEPERGLILGSGVAAVAAAALRDVFASISAAAAPKSLYRILCRPELTP
jgi:hypothetical protein